ncbi:Glutamate receptor 2 [Frankliniella fusca]|uniref:Glutamate receptor 2 n=1 Tax=Frankliniella fusca TaxID=407009 RepID=A0AAE1HLZ2_9NEOP|nr:Glutamate receptor 2 [Frankliniella fusca]
MDVATLCVALLLSVRARAALPVTHEVANEAAAALALLSPFLDTQNVTLALYGNASWTGDFLSGLSPRTIRVVLPDADQYWEQARFSPRDNIVVMFVGDGDVDPWRLMVREYGELMWRTLYWFAVQDESVLFTVPGHVNPLMMCGRDVGVAVTTPSGSTGLYYLDSSRCLTNNRASGAFKLADRWLPTEQRWQHGGCIFKVITSFCRGWRPAVPPEPLLLFHMPFREKSWGSAVLKMLRMCVRKELWRTTITTVNVTPGAIYESMRHFLKEKIKTCRLDALTWNVGGLLRFDATEVEILTENKWYPIVVVVPAGLGAVVNPLSSITLEFSPAVWLGTALAALGTVAALACTLRRDRGAALLLALAPLLAQPPPPPPPHPPPPAAGPALRPLLAVWLLVCVVLAAAYQGLLLGMLSSARPRGEIDSLEALADSALRVDVSAQLPNLDRIYGKNISRILNGDIITITSRTLHDIATHRNCAIITIDDRFLARTIRRLNIPQKRLHRFSLGHNTLKLVAMWSPGSPLGAPLASAYKRLDEAGVLDVWDNLVDDRDRHSLKSGVLQHPAALTLKHMQPAFLLLLVGYALASVVLVAELLAARWPRDGAGPVRFAPAPTNLEVRRILVRPCPVARRSASFSCTSQM